MELNTFKFLSNAGFMVTICVFAFIGWFIAIAISYASNRWVLLWILLITFTILDTYSLVQYYDKNTTIPIWDKISPLPPTSIIGPMSYISHVLAKVFTIYLYTQFNTLAVPTSTRLNIGIFNIDSSNTFFSRYLYFMMIYQKRYSIVLLLAVFIQIIILLYTWGSILYFAR